MTDPSTIQMTATILFALAVLHTFSTKLFQRLAHKQPGHAGVWHLLGEVEVVFGFWAMILITCMFVIGGSDPALGYLDSRNFTEPMFVFVIMVVAASKPVMQVAGATVQAVSRLLPLPGAMSLYLAVLCLVPLLGSLITEPAAMTLAALFLRDRFYSQNVSNRFKYATIGVLFVNISIGGTLTPFAAPPVLMVAGPWGWDVWFMLSQIGWKSAIAVVINALGAMLLFRGELAKLSGDYKSVETPVPLPLILLHLLILLGIVAFVHHPAAFMGFFLLFMGIATAYPQHQQRLILREGLLVGFFLAGLVVLGGLQQWWLEPLLMQMSANSVFYGAAALTAITDNAALTYLGSLVEGLSDEFKYALVTGAVAGGGLTVIANAPNPAGISILRYSFNDESVHPLKLLLAALPPTLVALLAYQVF
ncbi:MAG TPA: putative Na+/H+ antiporter [Gammaproteobacteria bacterium]|nr:putative Na+/H+ antiporter [Gammaproteobacteria bacterium]